MKIFLNLFQIKKMYICTHKLNITLSEKQGVEPGDHLDNKVGKPIIKEIYHW